MLTDLSPLSHGEAQVACPEGARDRIGPHTPLQNHILAALPRADFERVLPHLEPVAMPPGWVVHGAGQRQRGLYFPTEGIVARLYETEAGATAAFAFTGNEGVIGVASFLGGESMPSQAVVISPGYAYRLDARLLTSEFEHDGPLPQLLLRYTQSLLAQTWQIAACNGRHSLEQQFCRLLLSFLDRLPSHELIMTQELISAMLGVRRESITEVSGKLQRAGEIYYRRGHIAVLDRAMLEARTCECYRVIKREGDRLLFPENAAGDAGLPCPSLRHRQALAGTRRAARHIGAAGSSARAPTQRNDGRQ
jgi:CRP-like cAMP-binding protein